MVERAIPTLLMRSLMRRTLMGLLMVCTPDDDVGVLHQKGGPVKKNSSIQAGGIIRDRLCGYNYQRTTWLQLHISSGVLLWNRSSGEVVRRGADCPRAGHPAPHRGGGRDPYRGTGYIEPLLS